MAASADHASEFATVKGETFGSVQGLLVAVTELAILSVAPGVSIASGIDVSGMFFSA